MPLFTPEDLLRYLYKESSPELTAAIQVALNRELDASGTNGRITNLC